MRWGSAPDPAGWAYSAVQTPSYIWGVYFEEKGEGKKGKGRKGKGGEYNDEGGIWPTQKFWRSTPYARAIPLAGFLPLRVGSGKREGRGTEREKRGQSRRKNPRTPPARGLKYAEGLMLCMKKFFSIVF